MKKKTEVEVMIENLDAEIAKLQERREWLVRSRVAAAVVEKVRKKRTSKKGLPASIESNSSL